MLLRLYGFNFAISLAYNTGFFFSPLLRSLLGDVLKWPPDLLVNFALLEPKLKHYSAVITTPVDKFAARHDLRTSKRQGVQ